MRTMCAAADTARQWYSKLMGVEKFPPVAQSGYSGKPPGADSLPLPAIGLATAVLLTVLPWLV